MPPRVIKNRRGRFDGIKLLPFGVLFLLAAIARALRGFGRGYGGDDSLLILAIVLLLGLLLVGMAALITRLRK